MEKLKKFAASPAVTLTCFVLAVLLLGFSAVGGARAALTYYSDTYISTVQLQEIGVDLLENGQVVASGSAVARAAENALLQQMTLAGAAAPEPEGAPLKLGAKYKEELTVQNPASTGEITKITQYVRVTVLRYWLVPAADGAGYVKSQTLDPDLIDLHFTTGNGWVEDETARTRERRVLYYTLPLAPGETAPLFADALTISPDAAVTVERQEQGSTVTYTYLYDDASFQLEVTVDAVQDHNAENAIWSVWGRRVTIAPGDGRLNLV